MGIPATTTRRTAAVLGAAVLGLAAVATSLAGPASAQEYCVACTGPDAVYRCVIEQAVPTGMTLKLLCAGTMAREGNHGTCAIRGGTVFDCNGPIRRVDARRAANLLAKPDGARTGEPVAPALPPPRAVSPSGRPSGSPAAPPADTAAKPPEKERPASPPQTVEQLAKDVKRASGETLDKAGSAIGSTTRKAWD